MANLGHLKLLREDRAMWNRMRRERPGGSADLSGADCIRATLNRVDLSGADLSRADLSGALLRGADLSGANMSEAILTGTDLSRALLRGADLSGTDLRWANLCEANLRRANFYETDLTGTHLHAAHLADTIFAWVDLCRVEGLDMLIHDGPSIVDVRTVALPQGNRRTHFLRGAGFSDRFIEALSSLLTPAIHDESNNTRNVGP